ncbi:TPA: 3-hydroxyacyl-CoA dehydrogenase family protein [Burkholderia aenigmatica]|uniref:3-hydroxyacyl-CoA dehydrogenase family protein n=1 Tax=Burkholderia sp. AU45251 TaxID=3059204 RepID=UPI00264AE2DF|nr:3-hydroxyacyl-CoA dehydrogenase family protein [Burkholderia sp. AU45251]HDR9481978.1 3-hydroxyacyl-CoA dehydrogenase family protein [Burkholderia aenigmatica]MDN7515390.1 3-hydroxyacyl-CoA dehydrogenase family protein [Burkholderia sp. AU45251]HDR9515445.1 3-hydroxyacyl-CoA dehydrogenase family protein [Burkholderia aenigmatica]HDR9590349.1 3-hydroxyacyl-CoA dehydrogenase family protein [Burkholderia aenigmatica]HDR9598722.1 3-hydroxyacyl-CoA dehydrogenase family protein [Burkholderia aeni
MEKIAVIGAGLMGQGIAQVFALAGHQVKVHDVQHAVLNSLRPRTERNLLDLGQDERAVQRITPVADLREAVGDADAIFEAGPEDLAWKQDLFGQLERLAPAHAHLASNTSAIPITRIMERLASGHRALGTHWWNPPYLIPLVEIIKTPNTDAATAHRMFDLLTRAGKTPAIVEKDIAGFIGNRLQHALWREAISLVANGVCDARTVDTVVKASFGRRLPVLGPLENADLVGTDLTLAIHRVLLPEIENQAGPSPYLESLVRDGRLGMKTGEGFRRWPQEEQDSLRARLQAHLIEMNAAENR